MTLTRCVRPGLLAVALGLAACAAPPAIHYHTLLAPARPSTPADAPPARFLLDVLPVGIPEQLDQPQWVVRQGDSSLAVLDTERWAGPLGDEVRQALSAELTRRLGTQDIAGLARPAGKPILRVKLQVRRFDAWPGRHVRLDADWSLEMAGAPAGERLACRGGFDEPAPGGYPELALAQQRAIAQLASRIAADARGLGMASGLRCGE